MHRFLVPSSEFKKDRVLLNEKESHHALNVLRLKPGAVVEIFNGEGGSAAGILKGQKDGRVSVEVCHTGKKSAGQAQITLGIAVIKPDRMEWLVEKACELGAYAVAPLLADRGVVRLSTERWEAKIERWKKIAEETCKQCGQSRLPRIDDVVKFETAVKTFPSYDLVLLPTLAGQTRSLPEVLAESASAKKILVLIGPEGDFSPAEIAAAEAAGAVPVTLGDLTFRSETAAIFMLSVLRFQTALQA